MHNLQVCTCVCKVFNDENALVVAIKILTERGEG